MTKFDKGMTKILGVAGVIPFAGGFILTVTGGAGWVREPELVFVNYSAVILSFLCGAVWGRLLSSRPTRTVISLMVASNALALLAWLALLSVNLDVVVPLGLLSLGYLVVLLIELRSVELLYRQVYLGYLRLRIGLTTAVVILHGVMLGLRLST